VRRSNFREYGNTKISESLTESVIFDVKTIELVYVRKYVTDENGHINIDTYENRITPAWRITAINTNDSLTYMCYVDAADGGNFRYYSSTTTAEYN